MITLLFVILIYPISVYLAYLYIQKAHYHENGRWNNIGPGSSDKIIMFLPLANTFIAVSYLFRGWERETKTTFFKPKDKKDVKDSQ